MAATIVPAPDYEERVRASFARQQAMATIGAELTLVTPGIIEIEMPYSAALTQQHGFLHAGVISTALDSACGYAAFSLMPENSGVLTIEFKVNLLAPGRGERFLFRGSVTKPIRKGELITYDNAAVAPGSKIAELRARQDKLVYGA